MPDSPHGPRPFRLAVLVALLLASLFAAFPALEGDVLAYDDQPLLFGGDGGDGVLGATPGELLTKRFYYAYLPVYHLTLWADAKLGATAEETLLFRFQNVLWHAAASYVVFLLLGILLGRRWPAFAGAALFALHPLHTESVAWIAGRKDVVSGFLFFLAWLLALRAERARAWTFAALACFLLACFAKASAVVLPGVMLAAALLLPRYRGRRAEAALRTWPYLAVAVPVVLVHLVLGLEAGVVSESRPLGARLLSLVAAWGGAVWRSLLPLDLSLDYPEARATGLADVLLPALPLAAALGALVAFRRRAPVAAFGLAAFFVALLPFNNVFPATEVLAADRYLYLPLFGVALLAALLPGRVRGAGPVLVLVALAFLGLSAKSAARFRSDEDLWTATIAARDGSALAHINRGLARVHAGLTARPPKDALLRAGADDLRAGIARAALEEHRAKASAGLVVPLLHLGEVDEALERSGDALRAAVADTATARRFRATVRYNRGLVLGLGAGRHAEAAREFLESASLWPRFQSYYEGGLAAMRAGDADAARRALGRAGELDRRSPDPFLQLALLELQVGDRAGQRRALDEAARRAPRDPPVVAARAEYWLTGEAPDHRRADEELASLPEGPERRRLAAAVAAQRALYLFRRGAEKEAVGAADEARALGLAASRTLYELGQIYLAARRYDDAVACAREAGDVFEQGSVHRDAVARALALKADALLLTGDREGARRAMRAALDARPEVIEAGAAALRGELEELRVSRHPDLLLLAAAAVAGDVTRGDALADELWGAGLEERDRLLVYRLRALLRATAAFDFEAAEDDLRQVLAADPGDRWARFRIAEARMRSGVAWVRTGEQAGSAERRRQGAELLDSAIGLFGELLDEDPGFHAARLARGEARFLAGDLAGAKADYLALRERGARRRETYLKEAVLHRLVYVQGGDPANLESARVLLERALELDPSYFDALFELGNVHHNLYDRQDDPGPRRKAAFNRAIFWYRRAMALNPRVREPRVEWARIVLKAAREALAAGEVKSAHELVARVEQDAPEVADAHKERVRLALRPDAAKETGAGPDAAFEQAARALAEIERLAPLSPDLPALRSLYHRTRGWSFYLTWFKLSTAKTDPERTERARQLAVEEWTKACGAWPEDPENASLRDRLRELAPEVIVLDQEKAKAAYERGVKAFGDERWADAADAFREAALLFPESVDLRYYLAMSLVRAGRKEEGRDELQTVANHPDGSRYPDALYELGAHYLAARKPLVARPWFERYVRAMEGAGRGEEPLVRRAREILEELAGE